MKPINAAIGPNTEVAILSNTPNKEKMPDNCEAIRINNPVRIMIPFVLKTPVLFLDTIKYIAQGASICDAFATYNIIEAINLVIKITATRYIPVKAIPSIVNMCLVLL